MKGIVKGLIIGLVVIIIGAAILVGGLALNGWRISSNIEFEARTFTAENNNSALKIDLNAGAVVTEFYDGDKITVEYPYAKQYVTTFTENNGTLTVSNKVKLFSLFGFTIDIPQTVIRLPKDIVYDLTVDIDAGTVNIADGNYGTVKTELDAGTFKAGNIACGTFSCNIDAGTVNVEKLVSASLTIDVDAGTVKINSVDSDNTRVDVDAGTVRLAFTGAQSEYTIASRVSAGSCNVGTQTGSTNKSINVEVDAGSVNLTFGV